MKSVRPPIDLTHPPYRPDIDGLRAVAVLAVVMFHAFPNIIPGGFVGVDIFFVISGFLISIVIVRSLARGRFSFVEFYSRRMRRIFPALIAVLLCSFVCGWFFLLADEYQQLGKHIAGGAGFVSNLILWNERGYFDASAETKPLQHLWSLGIEEQFYLFYPVILWVAWKRRVSLLTITVVMAVTSFAVNLAQYWTDLAADFYSPLTRLWELMAGALLAHRQVNPRRVDRVSSALADDQDVHNAASVAGGILLLAGALLFNRDTAFPGWRGLLPVLGTVALISGGSGAWFNRRVLSNRVLVWTGLISFPLYLWHWTILAFVRIILGVTPAPGVRAGAVAVSVALAWMTYRFIELPSRSGPHPRRVTVFLAIAMCVVGGMGFADYRRAGFPSRGIQTTQDDVFDYTTHWKGWLDCQIVTGFEGNGGCSILAVDTPVKVAVIGDSHAGHLASGLRRHFAGKGVNVAVLRQAGCYPFYSLSIDGAERFACGNDLIDHALDFAATNDATEVIVLAGYAALQLHGARFDQAASITEAQLSTNLRHFDLAFRNTIERLLESKRKILYVIDTPELLQDPRSCVDRHVPWFRPTCHLDVPRAAVLERDRAYYALVAEYRTLYPSLYFFDPSDVLCDAQVCRGSDGETVLYATRDHLSPQGSVVVGEPLGRMIDTALTVPRR